MHDGHMSKQNTCYSVHEATTSSSTCAAPPWRRYFGRRGMVVEWFASCSPTSHQPGGYQTAKQLHNARVMELLLCRLILPQF